MKVIKPPLVHLTHVVVGTPMTARTPAGMTGNINATPRVAVDASAMQRVRPAAVYGGTPAYQPTPGTPYGYGAYQVLFLFHLDRFSHHL